MTSENKITIAVYDQMTFRLMIKFRSKRKIIYTAIKPQVGYAFQRARNKDHFYADFRENHMNQNRIVL